MPGTTPRPASGAQTLARGLAALGLVASSTAGLTVQDLADRLGVHRTIAYRILTTLVDARLVARGSDSRYRGAVGLLDLRAAGYESLKHAAEPLLATLADELGATVSLLVPEQDEAVALLVLSPRGVRYHISFSVGGRHPLGLGAGGQALSAAMPATPDESATIGDVRERGYAISYGQIEPGAWGLAVPLRLPTPGLAAACLNVISHREDIVRTSVDRVLACARDLESTLADV